MVFCIPELQYTAIPEENNSEITVYCILVLRYTVYRNTERKKIEITVNRIPVLRYTVYTREKIATTIGREGR